MKKIFEITHRNSTKKSIYIFGKKICSIKVKCKSYLPTKSQPKFGVSYLIFDGEELLEASIKSIRSQVDYINVVYQLTSWRGNPAKETLRALLEDLKVKKLIDELIFFEPNLSDNPQNNETIKRNIGLKAAVKAGVNYFMTMDCDEFYFTDEVARAKQSILLAGITHSYCAQVLYGDLPTLRQVSHHNKAYVQFFCKVDEISVLGANDFCCYRVDPTRMVLERKNSYHDLLNLIKMHHMTKIRKDLEGKYKNSSCDDLKKGSSKDVFIEVEDFFEINQIL